MNAVGFAGRLSTVAVTFCSVDRPLLALDADDVSLCDDCDGLGDGCPTCRGYRIVHGYIHGRGLPAVVALYRARRHA